MRLKNSKEALSLLFILYMFFFAVILILIYAAPPKKNGSCMTIYLPSHKSSKESKQDMLSTHELVRKNS